ELGQAEPVAREGAQVVAVALEPGSRALAELSDEGARALARLRHAVERREIGERRLAEEPRLLPAEPEDVAQQGAVVVGARAGARVVRAPQRLAEPAILEVRDRGHVARRVQREAVSREA